MNSYKCIVLCMYCIVFCTVQKSVMLEGKRGLLRSITRIRKYFKNLQKETNSDKKRAKEFENCIHEPIFNFEGIDLLCDLAIIPELHIFTGIVSHMFKYFKVSLPELANQWLEKIYLATNTNYGMSINGNDAKKMLEKLDVLEKLAAGN